MDIRQQPWFFFDGQGTARRGGARWKRPYQATWALILLAWVAAGSTGHAFASSFPYVESDAFLQRTGQKSSAANGERHFVRVSRDAVASAVSTGQLAIPLPTGDVVVARYERDHTNDRGDWTFVGKVDSAVGAQSVVITFGTDGVFGVIPSPSGHLLQVQSGAGGQAWVEPIDDLIPPGAERKSFAPGRLGESATHDHSQCYVIPPMPKAAGDRKPLTDEQAEALAKSGTTIIDVLGIYTTGVIEERGSAAAAETYFHSLVELSNQAFVDSGIDARYRVVGLKQVQEIPGRLNGDVLSDLASNRVSGIDAVAEREALQADLVTMLRKYQSGDPSCGIANLNGAGLNASSLVDGSPFSVNACGGYVMAHEFGHNLGSMHDIETTFGDTGIGRGGYGAYQYSFGYRQRDRFATIMAYNAGGPTLGRFSSPSSSQCQGSACGIADIADNARSLRLMAPRIAGFRRGINSDVAIRSASADEGYRSDGFARLWVESKSPAPVGGLAVDWETADGTAAAGWDYVAAKGRATIPQGSTFAPIDVYLIPDSIVEVDETVLVRLVAGGAVLSEAALTLRDNDGAPMGRVGGVVTFPGGATPPVQSFWVYADGTTVDGTSFSLQPVLVSPPQFGFQFSAPIGSSLRIEADAADIPPFSVRRVDGILVTGDLIRNIEVPLARSVSGRLQYSAGDVPAAPQSVRMRYKQDSDRYAYSRSVQASPPDFTYSFSGIPDGAWVRLESGTPALPSTAVPQYTIIPRLASNASADIVMSSTPTVSYGFGSTLRGAEGSSVCAFVGLSRALSTELLLPVSLISDSATVDVDAKLQGAGGALRIPAGVTSVGACVDLLTDSNDEPTERIILRLGDAPGVRVPANDRDAEVFIENVPPVDPNAPIEVRLTDVSVAEGSAGESQALVQLTLSKQVPASGARVRLATADGSAIAGADYMARDGSIELPPGLSSAVISVPLVVDRVDEADETFFLRVSAPDSPAPLVIADDEATIAIRNDDSAPRLRLVNTSIAEGDAGNQVVRVRAALSQPAPRDVSFVVSTESGSAAAGSDFLALSQSVTILQGQSAVDISISVIGDTSPEGNESFGVRASSPVGIAIEGDRAIVEVTDDDSSTLRNLRVAGIAQVEGNSGLSTFPFSVTLSAPAAAEVSFDVRAVSGTALSGVDFAPLASRVVIPAGATSAIVLVSVNGDSTRELDESFGLSITNVSGAILRNPSPVAVILNDDVTGSQAITFGAAPSVVVGGTGILSATGGGSGNPVVFNSTTPAICTVSGNTVTGVAAGTCTIAANQAGNASFTAAPQATQSFAIGLASQAITFGAAPSVVVGGTGMLRATGGGSGNPVVFSTLTMSVCGVSGSTVTGISAGTCTIAANQAGNASYAAAPQVTQSFPVMGLAPFGARDDRVLLLENSAGVDVALLGNDRFEATRLAGGSLTVVRQPGTGSVSVLPGADAASAADDQIRFVPARNWSGSDSLRYRLCEGGSQPRCAEATVFVEVRPISGGLLELSVATNRGFREVSLSGLRALPGVQFAATSLSAPVVGDLALAVDSTPETPWDNGRAGTAHVAGSLAGRSGSTLPWQVFAEAAGSGDVDLYVGEDSNGDGQPAEGELRCTSAMSAAGERCELALTVAAGGTGRYWAMVHNRGSSAQTGRLSRYEVPLLASDGSLVMTGPGILAAGESFPLRVQWDDPMLLGGESRVGYAQMILGGAAQAVFPVKLTRTAEQSTPLALESGVDRTLRIVGNGSHEQLFIDVPAGATRLLVTTTSSSNVDVYLARVAPPAAGTTVPAIGTAPPRNQAQASGTTPGGNESVEVLNPAAGRWYVTPVNMTGSAITVTVRATVSGTAPTVRAGGYFNTGRSGHGLFIYPAGSVWAGIWYTYREDRTPTWYYLQGDAPGANGIWQGDIYRATLVGGSRFLTAVGQGAATPTGPDAFTFSYTLDGQMGSEPFGTFGRGCPSIGGRVVDASGHWFDPTRTGTGYSLQLLPNYEFYALFLYTARGEPIFLTAERPGVGLANDTLPVQQLRGFCPLCERGDDPERSTVGVLRREFVDGRLSRMNVDVRFTNGVTGSWVTDDAVVPLGGLQGCAAN